MGVSSQKTYAISENRGLAVLWYFDARFTYARSENCHVFFTLLPSPYIFLCEPPGRRFRLLREPRFPDHARLRQGAGQIFGAAWKGWYPREQRRLSRSLQGRADNRDLSGWHVVHLR